MYTLQQLYAQLMKLESAVNKVRSKIIKLENAASVCPRCGAVGELEYVLDEAIYCTVNISDDGTPSSGECYEHGDCSFHHISCGNCGTYWESTGDFANEVQTKNAEVKA